MMLVFSWGKNGFKRRQSEVWHVERIERLLRKVSLFRVSMVSAEVDFGVVSA